MFYRIVDAPPGYASDQRFVVAEYESKDFDSRVNRWQFAASLDEARRLIPMDAVQMPFEPQDQFLELYWRR